MAKRGGAGGEECDWARVRSFNRRPPGPLSADFDQLSSAARIAIADRYTGKLMRLKILLCHLLITVVGVTQARADVSVVCTYAVITELHEELTFCEETLSSDIEARYRTIHEMLGNFIQARSEGAWRKYGPGWQQDLRSSLTRADRVEVCDHPQLNRKDTLERLLSEENMSEYRERLKRGVDPEEGGCL